MGYYKIILQFLIFGISCAQAQLNLVPNPSFEKLKSTPKNVGELFKASPWLSPTDGTADVFSKKTNTEDIGAPKNAMGEQIARTGVNYAGAIFFSKKTNNTREYVQAELLSPLELGRTYCVEFFVSLSDLSKYGIDRIGVYISKDKVGAKNWDPLPLVPQISNIPGRILSEHAQWELICGEYKAQGGEKYFTIGNFYPNDETKIKKLKKPSKIKGSQNDYGYYYIDDVSLKDIDDVGITCGCEKKMKIIENNSQMQFVYSKVSGETEEEVDTQEIIESKSIFFDEGKVEITEQSKLDLKLIMSLLQDNPTIIIEILGHADEQELKKDAKIAMNRANTVLNNLVLAGIKKERLKTSDTKPINIPNANNESIRSQNRKVDFSVVLE